MRAATWRDPSPAHSRRSHITTRSVAQTATVASCLPARPRADAERPLGCGRRGPGSVREKFRRRLPESLDELQGPAHGVVELPPHMAWSGMAS